MTRRTQRPFRAKPGAHGTLYLYAVPYQDGSDRDSCGTSRLWAYDAEHAAERFYDTDDTGWRVNGAITRVREPAGG